jgi:primosomal protein N' (replication factor Y)
VADDVTPESDAKLLDILAVASAGPPPDVVALTEWIAWRWAGPRVAVLRSASPPNRVPPEVCRESAPLGVPHEQTVVRTPPLLDRRARVADLCATNGSTIVCVADAGRARALATFLERDGRAVALMHSATSDADRTRAWERAARGDVIVVGGRVAALAPVPDLAAAIVVDDADEALQEERSPTWHARDVLRERAERGSAPFFIVSPAPTLEAVVAADHHVDAPAPDVERAGWPRVEIVDRRKEPPGAGLLTDALAHALRRADGLAVCVLNRRGRFRLLACSACHHLIRVLPDEDKPAVCPECGAAKLRVIRSGATRVGEELQALLPDKTVADAEGEIDTNADIVIGTEAVLHRGDVRRRQPTLVAYLDLDQELLAPRFRAATQAHWLVTRGAQLLSARPRADTVLLLQTRLPDHVVVEAIAQGRPELVAKSEAEYRTALGYPPFGALAELTGDELPLATLAEGLRGFGIAVFGPTDGHALVNAATDDLLADALAEVLPDARAHGRVRAAVDPPRV